MHTTNGLSRSHHRVNSSCHEGGFQRTRAAKFIKQTHSPEGLIEMIHEYVVSGLRLTGNTEKERAFSSPLFQIYWEVFV